MDELTTVRITVMFEEPFWVCIFERQCGRKFEACKITFGAEPKDYEVYEFLLKNYNRLTFSPPVKARSEQARHISPKRMQRVINKQLQGDGIGTKAQQAFKAMQEQNKLERRVRSRDEKEAEEQRKFELRQTKRKEKHRGH